MDAGRVDEEDAGVRVIDDTSMIGGPHHCDPPCPSGTRCEVAAGVLECVHLCNPPDGCALPEACDEQTRRCGPPLCNGVQCDQGQDCIDPNSGVRYTATAVCTCVTYQMAADGGVLPDSDSCSRYGLACQNASKGPAQGEPWAVGECN